MMTTRAAQCEPWPLAADEVHVWVARVPGKRGDIDELLPFLTQEDQRASNRYLRQEDRAMSVLSRALRREILSRYCGEKPLRLRFGSNQYGKPALEGQGNDRIRFNITHSGGLTAIAVGCRDVGVDIELIRSLDDIETLAARFFSRREYTALMAFEGYRRVLAFFAAWSRKEALVKALGQGMSFPLWDFDVELDASRAPRLLGSRHAMLHPEQWTMASLDVGSRYATALAVEGRELRVIQREWPDLEL